MGTIQHNAVIATTWDEKEIRRLKKWISSLPKSWQGLFTVSSGVVNDYQTITMSPDGSKEGWSDSEMGDELRERFIAEINSPESHWEFVEVSFGELGQKIVQGNCEI